MYPKLKPIAAAIALTSFTATPIFAADKDLDPIVVTATRQATRASEILSDVTIIERDEIERAGPAGSLAELLSMQPGVQYKSNGGLGSTSDITLRGGAKGTHTLVLIDGIRNIPGNGGFPWQAIPLSQIDRIEILRGPASSLYGSDAIGGVIQIFTKRGDGPMQFNAELGAGSYQTTSASAGLSGKADAWRYNLQVSDIGTRGINATTPQSGYYNPDKDGYANHSLNGSLSYALSHDTEIGTQLLHTDGRVAYDSGYSASTRLKNYQSDTAIDSLSTYLSTTVSQNWKTTFRMGQSTTDYKTYTNHVGTYEFKTTQNQYVWQNDIKTDFGRWMLAAEQLDQKIETAAQYPETQRKISSLVAGWTKNIGDHLFQVSGRHDDNSQFGKKTTGTGSYGYQINSDWRASTSLGTAFRAPTFVDLYYTPSCSTSGLCYGNPNLRPESSLNREGAISYEHGSQKLRLTVFANTITDLITLDSNWYPVNAANAQIKGASIDYAQRFGTFDVSANYTQQDAQNTNTGLTLQNQADRYGSLRIGQQLGALRWQLEGVGVGRRFANGDNQYEMGGYGLVNLYSSYQLNREWTAFARLNNLFDRKYELTQNFNAMGANVFAGIRYTPQ